MLALCGTLVCPAAGRKNEKKNVKVEATSKKKAKTKYDKLIGGSNVQTQKGFITLHKIGKKIYFEYPLKYLNRDILLGSTIAETTDNRFGCVGEKSSEPFLIRFVMRDSTMTLRWSQVPPEATDPQIKKRLKSSTMPAIMETFKVEAYNNDSTAVVFDMTDYLVSDKKRLTPFSPYSAFEMMGATIDKDFERESSFLDRIKAFPDNVSIRSLLTYKVSVGAGGSYAVRKMPFSAMVNRTFILLPEKPMRVRYADPRIGIFEHSVTQYASEGRGLRNLHLAHKWNLEPSDTAAYLRGELVEPTKPIVFYIDDTFPLSWNKYIHKGVEVWQKAFEKIGFKNAIIAKDFPKNDPDFDPENIKYSCIRYAPSTIANAMGPSWIDPRSGEILTASVTVYHNIVELVQNWRFLQTAQTDEEVRDVKLRDDLLGDCIAYVLSHEVGHTLALMHNMAASSSIPVESLRDPKFTQKYGTTYSIMDYARNNYIAQPGDKQRGVRLTPPELGEYDYYAINWLYRPILDAKTPEDEVATLDKWISEKSGDPKYRYGKQQFKRKIDPSSIEEDLGNDPVKASEYGRKNLQYILKHMNAWVATKDKDFEFRRAIYDEIVAAYVRYLRAVLCDVGGIYLNERYEGDARKSYEVVSREQQRKALHFLLNETKDLDWLNANDVMKEFPIHSSISAQMEDAIIDGILSRCTSVSMAADKAASKPYTQTEYLQDIENFIWAPTRSGKDLTATDMRLQMSLLTKLINGACDGIVKNASRKSFTGIDIPTEIEESFKTRYGLLSHEAAACSCHQHMQEVSGFAEDDVELKAPFEPMEHVYFGELKKIRTLIAGKVSTGSADTQRHYRLLLYKIDQALK